jgi:hypothetical protein
MEQYIHILIAAESQYVPSPPQIVEFFDVLVGDFQFRIIRDGRWQPGLRVSKPGGRTRTGTNRITGETITIPIPDHIEVEKTTEIPPLIENLEEYRVGASGEWKSADAPILLRKVDKTPFAGDPISDVSCNIRPIPVSTSAWDVEAGPNVRNVPLFGSIWNGGSRTGIFPNAWTGEVIEVPQAGSARFWIEFEFGRFLYPSIGKSLDVLDPRLVKKVEECFQTKFAQGCRFW